MRRWIRSASTPQHIDYEVILVDDAADAGTKALLSAGQRRDASSSTRPTSAICAASTAASTRREGAWLVLCNNDIEVQPGWLAAMLDCGESAPTSRSSPRSTYTRTVRSPRRAGSSGATAPAPNYGRGQAARVTATTSIRREIDYGSAAALLVRRDFWRGGRRVRRALPADVLRGHRPLL